MKMIIYKTTNLINGKIYIGQDTKNNPNYYGSGKIFIQALKKYGKNNFTKETIDECFSMSDLNNREKYWIKFYKSQDRKIGYNILEGGNGVNEKSKLKIKKSLKGKILTEETKNKISKALKGRIFSKEQRKKISKNHADVSGEKNPMYGKKHSQYVKEQSRIRNLGKKASNSTKEIFKKQRQGEKNSNAKLTEKQVVEIRRIYFEGNIKMKEIAQLFNTKEPCVWKIINYRTWKNI